MSLSESEVTIYKTFEKKYFASFFVASTLNLKNLFGTHTGKEYLFHEKKIDLKT